MDGEPAVLVNGKDAGVRWRKLPMVEVLARYARSADAADVVAAECELSLN